MSKTTDKRSFATDLADFERGARTGAETVLSSSEEEGIAYGKRVARNFQRATFERAAKHAKVNGECPHSARLQALLG